MDCFRTCDIRGKYPQEVDEELYHHIGLAMGLKFVRGGSVLVGSDVRTSSSSLKEALVEGLLESGSEVLDAGSIPTPVLYFGKRRLGVPTAAIITASHNPPEFNG